MIDCVVCPGLLSSQPWSGTRRWVPPPTPWLPSWYHHTPFLAPPSTHLTLQQGTLALIKPDAFHRRIEIEEIILNEGFRLVDKKRLRFTRELAEEFYRELKDEETFGALVSPSSSPSPGHQPSSPSPLARWTT